MSSTVCGHGWRRSSPRSSLCEEQVETALHAGSALALGVAMDRATAMLDEAWARALLDHGGA